VRETSARRLVAYIARRSALDSASLEDIVQCALIKAVRNVDSDRGEAALFTWLSVICRHELAEVRRNAARRPAHVSLGETATTQEVVAQLRAPEHQEPVAELDAATHRVAVMQILNSLPECYARALEAK
jgi:DNA-directed RNA polymerase specialized sigma24 family protein